MVFACDRLAFTYPGAAAPAVVDLDAQVPRTGVHAIVGPNGSGKSTLLKLMAGTLEPSAGTVHFLDRALSDWPRRELARVLGVVAQSEDLRFPLTVRELVALGRYPYLGPWQRERTIDRDAVASAMERCEVTAFAERPASSLSGGEFQRARIARALAQEPEVLLLDEPTSALDIHHQMATFGLLRDLAHTGGVTVLVVTHQLNLAARFADTLLLLHEGRRMAQGTPVDVLTESLLEDVYDWPLTVVPFPAAGPDRGAPQVVPLRPDSASDGRD